MTFGGADKRETKTTCLVGGFGAIKNLESSFFKEGFFLIMLYTFI
ncbi:MAG: hypothetical protein ACYDEJ_08430 [Desulfitobacteriaceae bacterium]